MAWLGNFIADQKERLGNVAAVTGIASAKVLNTVSFGIAGNLSDTIKNAANTKIVANTSSTKVNAVLELAANNPVATAAVLPVGAPGVGVTALGKTASMAKNVFNSMSGGWKATTVGAGIVAVNAAIKSPEGATKVANMVTPDAIVDYLSEAGQARSVEDVIDLAKSNPVVTTILAGAGAVVAGKAVGTAVNAISGYRNTQAIRENTEAMYGAAVNYKDDVVSSIPESDSLSSPQVPSSTDAPVAAIGPKKKYPTSSRRKRRKVKTTPTVNVRINNNLVDLDR